MTDEYNSKEFENWYMEEFYGGANEENRAALFASLNKRGACGSYEFHHHGGAFQAWQASKAIYSKRVDKLTVTVAGLKETISDLKIELGESLEKLDVLKNEKRRYVTWVNNTVPCKSCAKTGKVRDGWSRDQTCNQCDGKGRY